MALLMTGRALPSGAGRIPGRSMQNVATRRERAAHGL